MGCAIDGRLVHSLEPDGKRRRGHATESNVGLVNRQNRRHVAIVVTSDGRRVHVPLPQTGFVDVVVLPLLRSLLLGLDGLLGLITGSRQENGGSRR
jgi:hypothetical protein